MITKNTAEVTDAELEYFRTHPSLIDEITAPVNIHSLFLYLGALLGTTFFALSKILNYFGLPMPLSEGVKGFIVDLSWQNSVLR
jgi:hypothetical protein